jgi:hypothetical protein
MKKLFLLLIVLYAVTVQAQLSSYTDISFRYINTDSSSEFFTDPNDSEVKKASGYSGMDWEYHLNYKFNKNLFLTWNNQLFYSEVSSELRNSFLYDKSRLSIGFRNSVHKLSLFLNNRFYGDDDTTISNIAGLDTLIKKRATFAYGLNYELNFGKLEFATSGYYRNLRYLEYTTSQNEWENDLYLASKLGYQIIPHWQIFTNFYYKDDLNQVDWYDQTKWGAGVAYENRFDFFNSVEAVVNYFHSETDELPQYQNDYLFTKVRYFKRFGTTFSSFITYINRSTYNTSQEKLLRISNLIRLQAKYIYQEGRAESSYLLFSGKYNPENSGSKLRLGVNQHLFKDLYFGIAGEYAPDLYNGYEGEFRYLLSGFRYLYLRYQLQDYQDFVGTQKIQAGLSYQF